MTAYNKGMTLIVGLGEVKTSQDPSEVLTCLGLGSCVGVCMYDPVAKVAGMAHIVLPYCDGKPENAGKKYADSGVPLLLEILVKKGAIKNRVIVKIAGGAQISRSRGLGDAFKIGERNVEAVRAVLAANSMRVKGTDTGGHQGRTMRFYLDAGQTLVTTAGKEIREI